MAESNSSPRRVTATQSGLARLLLAFEATQYRWLWSSTLFTSMAMSVRMLAQGWLVLETTDSPFWVGAVAGLQGAGQVGFGTFGGTIADRFDRRKLLAMVNLGNGGLAILIGVLVIAHRIELWHILVTAPVQGVFTATQLPTTNSLAYQIVGPQRLLNAMATRVVALNMSRVIGSLVAGALLSQWGSGSAYLFSGVTFALGMGLLWFIKGSFQAAFRRDPFWQATGQGLRYIWGNSAIRRLLILSVCMETFGFSHVVLLPVMARDVLEVGATGLGFLSAASGLASTLSTIVVASLGDFKRKEALLTVMAIGAGITLVLFAVSPWFAVSICMVALAGGFLMAYDATMGTVLQLLSSDDMRGRVMGVYGTTFGFTTVGGFVAGAVATALSAPIAVAAGGVVITAFVASIARSIVRTGSEPPLEP